MTKKTGMRQAIGDSPDLRYKKRPGTWTPDFRFLRSDMMLNAINAYAASKNLVSVPQRRQIQLCSSLHDCSLTLHSFSLLAYHSRTLFLPVEQKAQDRVGDLTLRGWQDESKNAAKMGCHFKTVAELLGIDDQWRRDNAKGDSPNPQQMPLGYYQDLIKQYAKAQVSHS